MNEESGSGSRTYKPVPQGDPPAYDPTPQTNMQEYQLATGGHSGGLNVTTVTVQPLSVQGDIGPKPNNYIAFSVVNMLCCCLILGIVALVRGLAVDSHYTAGRYEDAKKASREARAINIAGVVIGFLVWIAVVILNVVRVVSFQGTTTTT